MSGDSPSNPVLLCLRGGARIGFFNATWPLAKLEAAPDRLSLSVFILGKYSFSPQEVRRIERVNSLPIIGQGIRIIHNVSRYPKKIVFWTLEDPARLIDGILKTGFLPQGELD